MRQGAFLFSPFALLPLTALVTLEKAAHAEPEQVSVRGGQSGGFTSRADEASAPREVTDAASLLAPLPGVHVRRFGGDDALSTISIRGSSSSQVTVLLGGVPLTGGADPSLDLGSLPLWPGATMRVYRSFAPASLGPGSLGGTLVLRAPSPGTKPRTEVWTAAGSFGALRLRAGDSRKLGQDELSPDVTTALSVNRSDGDFTYVDPIAAASGVSREAVRKNASVAAANGLVQWSMPFVVGGGGAAGSLGRITVLTLLQARRQGVPGTAKLPTESETLESTRALASLEVAVPVSETGTMFVRTWGRRDHLALRSRPEEAARLLSPSRTADTIVAVGASIGLRARPGKNVHAELRFDGSGERFAPGTWVGTSAPDGATRGTFGFGADLEAKAFEKLSLTLSSRTDLWHDVSSGTEDVGRQTGHAGLEIDLSPVVLAAHAGRLARAPSFVERYGNRGIFLGSPNLRPEAATTIDVGASAHGKHGIAQGKVELVGFSTWAEDLITFVPQGAYGRAKAANIGRARLLGLEADATGRIDRFELRASYTFLATANDSECESTVTTGCVAPPLPGRPAHDFVLDASVRLGPARLRYGLDVVADLRADLTGATRVPARALQSVGAKLVVPGLSWLTLALDVSNLADVRGASYQGALGPVVEPIGDLYEYPLPGRSFLATARVVAPD